MIAGLLVGVPWLLLVGLGLCVVAAAATDLWRSDESTEELAVDIAAAAFGLTGALVGALGMAGLLGRVPVLVAVLAMAALVLRLRGSRPLRLIWLCVAEGARGWARSPWLACLLLLAAATLARGLSIPQLAWDGLTYHLSYPASWVKHGAIVRFEGGGVWESYETFPKGTEALHYLVLQAVEHDHFVNLVNLPLWLMSAAAARAIALRLGAGRGAAEFGALLLCANPVMLAYVTPAYVEVPKVFALLAGVSAATRVLPRGDPRALIPLGVALGLGLAIKLTSLTWIGPALLVTLFSLRVRPQQTLRAAASAVLAAVLVAGVWYVHNAARCGGNPIYPAPIPGAVDGPAAGSTAAAWALKETSVLSQATLDDVFQYLAIPPWVARYPLGPGWPFILSLAVAPLLLLFSARAQRLRAALPLALSLQLFVVYLVTPWNGVYVVADTRFLAPCFAAALLSCTVALAAAPRVLRWMVGLAGAGATVGYLPVLPLVDAWWASWAALGVAACALASVAAFAWRSRPTLPALAALLAGLSLLPMALSARERGRFDLRYDLHTLPLSSTSLWREVSELPPSKVAFSAGGPDATEGWFYFPLFGPDLRHSVHYVDIQADGDARACHRRGLIRKRPDRDAWLSRLEAMGIRYLVTTHNPPEQAWAQELPQRFVLRAHKPAMRIYEVRR